MATSSVDEGNTFRHHQIVIYLPSDIDSPVSGYIYGITEVISNSIVNVYVASIDREIRPGTSEQVQLIGIFNKKTFEHNHQPSIWIEIEWENRRLTRLVVSDEFIPSRNVMCVVYDKSVFQSEILGKNENWTKSNVLRKLESISSTKQIQESYEKLPKGTPRKAMTVSKLIYQLHSRHQQFRLLRTTRSELEFYNLLSTILIDFFLGLLVFKILHSFGGTVYVLQSLSASLKLVADYLQNLVEWLTGVPVGLKLNRQLSTVLARFFLYHLYLWKTYIDIIRPILSTIITISSMFSILGFSFQVALLSDMISVATLHAYCFYIYAARLYGFTLQGLRSTLRMFSGSKWNPLRKRVDYGHFSWDQLCIGMFIATTLLLLLPTVLVYYIVFLSLRLTILVIQGTLKWLIWLINISPLFTILLWMLNAPSIAGDVHFQTISSTQLADDEKPSILKLSGIRLPLTASIKLTLNQSSGSEWPHFDLVKLIGHMFSGQLMNPFKF